MRKKPFIVGGFYHIYNRGVDKRNVFSREDDIMRFFQSMEEFNVIEPIGSIYVNSCGKKYLRSRHPASIKKINKEKKERLVNFVCYCLNPNHYHFILEELVDGGISEFMKRLGGGYTKYFNDKYNRSGVLFQGRFKSEYIDSDSYLLHASVYVNLNNRIHKISGSNKKFVKSSWDEYVGESKNIFCTKDVVINHFKSKGKYKKFAEETLKKIIKRRYGIEDEENFLLE